MKLEKYALLAEIISSIAIIATVIVLIFEVRGGTEATLAANRQSLASRTEELLITLATSPDLLRIRIKAENNIELTDVEELQYSSYIAAFLRLAEEAYLQYRDEQLSEEYWLTRANNLVDTRVGNKVAREYWDSWNQQGWFTADFATWLDEALEEKLGTE